MNKVEDHALQLNVTTRIALTGILADENTCIEKGICRLVQNIYVL